MHLSCFFFPFKIRGFIAWPAGLLALALMPQWVLQNQTQSKSPQKESLIDFHCLAPSSKPLIWIVYIFWSAGCLHGVFVCVVFTQAVKSISFRLDASCCALQLWCRTAQMLAGGISDWTQRLLMSCDLIPLPDKCVAISLFPQRWNDYKTQTQDEVWSSTM